MNLRQFAGHPCPGFAIRASLGLQARAYVESLAPVAFTIDRRGESARPAADPPTPADDIAQLTGRRL